jgi:predicted SAM-dependent methyltransferase
MKLLNVGCGERFHPEWTNLDLGRSAAGVISADLRQGIPFPDAQFDSVYHSHVLEHLAPADGRNLIRECYRVLKPDGILRVVVPDLEGIARHYLKSLDALDRKETNARANHHWMTLELLDQMVRSRSGGEMTAWIRNPESPDLDFVRARMGAEFETVLGGQPRPRAARSIWSKVRNEARRVAERLALALVVFTSGSRGAAAYREGRFRQAGEIHRWMYDRVSLGALLEELGFLETTVCAPRESRIADFGRFQLDVVDGRVRKPDSLFIESVKPATLVQRAA